MSQPYQPRLSARAGKPPPRATPLVRGLLCVCGVALPLWAGAALAAWWLL